MQLSVVCRVNETRDMRPDNGQVSMASVEVTRVTQKMLVWLQSIRTLRHMRRASCLTLMDMSHRIQQLSGIHYGASALSNYERGRARYYTRADGTR